MDNTPTKYSNFLTTISPNYIPCISVKDQENLIKTKINHVAGEHFKPDVEKYNCQSTPSSLEKCRMIPLGVIKSFFSLPFHLFESLIWSRTPDLSILDKLKRTLYVLEKDLQEARGYITLIFNEKKALYLIDDAKFQKNCLFKLYHLNDRKKFISELFKDLVFYDIDLESAAKNDNPPLNGFLDFFKNEQLQFSEIFDYFENRGFIKDHLLQDKKIVEFWTKHHEKMPEHLYLFFRNDIIHKFRSCDHILILKKEEFRDDLSWLDQYFDDLVVSHLDIDVVRERAFSFIEEISKSNKKDLYLKKILELIKKKNIESIQNTSSKQLYIDLKNKCEGKKIDNTYFELYQKYKEVTEFKEAFRIIHKAHWFKPINKENIFNKKSDAQKNITDLFDLDEKSSFNTIRKKYKQLARIHPDKYSNNEDKEMNAFGKNLFTKAAGIIHTSFEAYKYQMRL